MGNYTPRPAPQVKLSEEEKKAQAIRAFMQKRASVAEAVLFNLCGNPSIVSTAFAEPDKIADAAVKIADSFMETLYSEKAE